GVVLSGGRCVRGIAPPGVRFGRGLVHRLATPSPSSWRGPVRSSPTTPPWRGSPLRASCALRKGACCFGCSRGWPPPPSAVTAAPFPPPSRRRCGRAAPRAGGPVRAGGTPISDLRGGGHGKGRPRRTALTGKAPARPASDPDRGAAHDLEHRVPVRLVAERLHRGVRCGLEVGAD